MSYSTVVIIGSYKSKHKSKEIVVFLVLFFKHFCFYLTKMNAHDFY